MSGAVPDHARRPVDASGVSAAPDGDADGGATGAGGAAGAGGAGGAGESADPAAVASAPDVSGSEREPWPAAAEDGVPPGLPPAAPKAAALGPWAPLWFELPDVGDPGRQAEVVPLLSDVGTGVADTVVDFVFAEPFEVRAASTRGWSHRHGGAPRQDAFAIASTDGWVVVAVADGVSQGRFSHLAAEVAARASVRLLCQRVAGRRSHEVAGAIPWPDLVAEISSQIVREALHRRFFKLPEAEGEIDPADAGLAVAIRRHMATTLIVALVSTASDADGAYPTCLVNVAGDSAGYVASGEGLALAGGGKQAAGGIADTAVRPLPGPARPAEDWFALAPGHGLLLVSDGLADPFGDGSSDIARALHELWRHPPRPAELVEHINFQRRTYDDDRTMVGVWAPEPADP